MNVPKLRFKDVDGREFPEWKDSTIGEKVNEKASKFNPEKHTDNFKCIELEHLSQNTGELLGYADTVDSKSIKNKFEAGDVLFGKLRPYLRKFLKAPFSGVCSTEIWVLKGKKISNDFLFQFVQTENFITQANISSGSKMPRADWNVVSSALAYFPSLPEQTKIANFLTAIDEKITQFTQKYDLLKQYKKGVMQQIFSQKLRFKDDDGREFPEWEVREIGDVFKVTRGNVLSMGLVSETQTDVNQYPVYSSQTKNSGLSGYYNDYLYEDSITWTTDGANAGDVNYRNGKFYCTNVCGVLISNEGFANAFVAAMINAVSKKYVSYVGNPKLMNGVMAKISIEFPCVKEQTKIANFLTAIDDKITHTQTQLEAVKLYKKGLLQQMFV